MDPLTDSIGLQACGRHGKDWACPDWLNAYVQISSCSSAAESGGKAKSIRGRGLCEREQVFHAGITHHGHHVCLSVRLCVCV